MSLLVCNNFPLFFQEFTYRDIKSWTSSIDNNPDWIVTVWFKNFKFEYEEEYLVCDYTCVIGEIGGNLGFFLGGSILAYMDMIMLSLKSRLKKV